MWRPLIMHGGGLEPQSCYQRFLQRGSLAGVHSIDEANQARKHAAIFAIPCWTVPQDAIRKGAVFAGMVLAAVAQVLVLLMADYRHSFRPSLEHVAQFTAGILTKSPSDAEAQQAWQHLTCLVIRLLRVRTLAAMFACCW